MSNLRVCITCGAPAESAKCQFCGTPVNQESRTENLSNQKLIAEREFENGNYTAALREYELFYKQNPNDSYTILRRAECLFALEEIEMTQYFHYIKQAIELAKTDDFHKYAIGLYIDTVSYKTEVQSIDSIGLSNRLDSLCEHRTDLLDFAINKLISEVSKTEDYIDKYEDLLLVLIYDSVNSLARSITLDEVGKSGFENSMEFNLSQKIICLLSSLEKEKWQMVYDFEDDMVSGPDYEYDLAPLYILDKINCSFVGKIAYKYIQSYFSKSRRWYNDEQWIEGLNKIPKDLTNTFIINVINKQVNEILEDKEKPFKYSYTDGIKKPSFGVGGKGSCFIATATMGSHDHPLVIDLRYFRDNWLLKRKWGYDFTNWYYTHGPIAAKVIGRFKILRILSFYILIKPLHLIISLIKYK
jgi:hypothetical protein